jgi:hypothetical protein
MNPKLYAKLMEVVLASELPESVVLETLKAMMGSMENEFNWDREWMEG